MTLHLYKNDVIEWFSAETSEEAEQVARAWYAEIGAVPDDDSFPLKLVPDDKLLKCDSDDGEGQREQTASAWAAENGKGFWASTEW